MLFAKEPRLLCLLRDGALFGPNKIEGIDAGQGNNDLYGDRNIDKSQSVSKKWHNNQRGPNLGLKGNNFIPFPFCDHFAKVRILDEPAVNFLRALGKKVGGQYHQWRGGEDGEKYESRWT